GDDEVEDLGAEGHLRGVADVRTGVGDARLPALARRAKDRGHPRVEAGYDGSGAEALRELEEWKAGAEADVQRDRVRAQRKMLEEQQTEGRRPERQLV